jgi:hypothetical protein
MKIISVERSETAEELTTLTPGSCFSMGAEAPTTTDAQGHVVELPDPVWVKGHESVCTDLQSGENRVVGGAARVRACTAVELGA